MGSRSLVSCYRTLEHQAPLRNLTSKNHNHVTYFRTIDAPASGCGSRLSSAKMPGQLSHAADSPKLTSAGKPRMTPRFKHWLPSADGGYPPHYPGWPTDRPPPKPTTRNTLSEHRSQASIYTRFPRPPPFSFLVRKSIGSPDGVRTHIPQQTCRPPPSHSSYALPCAGAEASRAGYLELQSRGPWPK